MDIGELYKAFLVSEGVSTDTRSILENQIFFALSGNNFDGNRYIDIALQKGCRLIICDDPSIKGSEKVSVVSSSLETLQALANMHREEKGIPVLAITGSNGKTTTKELIARVLSAKYKVLATPGNLNNHIGVPLTLLQLKDEEIAVIEMGANHPGEIALLCTIADPDAGIITNIGKAHLEGFGGLEGVKKAKGELYDYLAKNHGNVILNAADPVLMDMAHSRDLKLFTYGESDGAMLSGKLLEKEPEIKASFNTGNRDHAIGSCMTGHYNFINILCAAATGVYFNVDPEAISEQIAGYRPDNNRSQILEGNCNTLLLDAYNANPSSMMLALEEFRSSGAAKKMLVLGDMMELGKEAEPEHERILDWLLLNPFDKIILVGNNFMKFADKDKYDFSFFRELDDCLSYLAMNKPCGFKILLKGSRKIALERATNLLLDC